MENKTDCHAQIIARYFDDFSAKPCGICDNCIEQKKTGKFSKTEFSALYTEIIAALHQTPLTIKELMLQLHIVDEKKMWTMIDHLLGEKKVEMMEETKAGKVMIKKKGQDKNPARF